MPEVEHELHKRRQSRNIGTALALALLVVLLMGLTIVKLTNMPVETDEVTSQ